MPVKALIIPLEPGKYYHVYNRGNNKENLFHDPLDYSFFMRKYQFYLDPYVKTYAFCLLPNHFHFLIQVNEDLPDGQCVVSNQFRKLFICHARRVNTIRGRKGCLLTRNFRRVEITDENYLQNVVRYIHFNPIKHGYVTDISFYQFCSFSEVIHQSNHSIHSTEVLKWFGGMELFLKFHKFTDNNDVWELLPDDWTN